MPPPADDDLSADTADPTHQQYAHGFAAGRAAQNSGNTTAASDQGGGGGSTDAARQAYIRSASAIDPAYWNTPAGKKALDTATGATPSAAGRGGRGRRGAVAAPATGTTPKAGEDDKLYTAPAPVPSAGATDATERLLDEKARKSAGVSRADWTGQGLSKGATGVNDPNFFKSAADRTQDLNDAQAGRVEAGRNIVKQTIASQGRFDQPAPTPAPAAAALPRVTPAGPTPAVGGTQAVNVSPRPAIPPAGVGTSGTITPTPTGNVLESPFGSGRTTFGGAPGTRTPFIAGTNGQNVARNFVAGGRFSTAPAGSDKSLAPAVAALPRARVQAALPKQPVPRIFRGNNGGG